MLDFREEHLSQFSAEPELLVRVPGIARLFGGFAEYCKGRVICAALEDSLYLSINRREDNVVCVNNSVTGEKKKFLLSSLKFRKEDHMANCIKGICKFLGIPVKNGADICLFGPLLNYDLENSECAVAVAFTIALNSMLDLNLSQKEMCDVVIKSITAFCQNICPMATILSMLNAKQNQWIAFDVRKNSLSYIRDPFKDSPYSLVITRSGIGCGNMREETDEVRQNCSTILKKFNGQISVSDLPSLNGDRKKTALYLNDELYCSQIAEKAFAQSDFQSIGKVLARNGRNLTEFLDYCCPETDWLIKRSSEMTGCLGSSIIFTGSDGVVAGLFRNDSLAAYKEKLSDYEHFFGLRAKLSAFVPSGAAAIVEKG